METLVRTANSRDYAALKEFYNSAGLSFQHALGDQFWLIELESKPIAALRLSLENNVFVLRHVAVAKKYRRKGLARSLLSTVNKALGRMEGFCIALREHESALGEIGFKKIKGLCAPDFLIDRTQTLLDSGHEAILMHRFRDIEVRPITTADLLSAMTLLKEFDFTEAKMLSANDVRAIYNQIISSGGIVLGAFRGAKIIGTCTVNICANLSWSGRPYSIIENIIVTQNERGNGIGKALLLFAKHFAASKNCYKVALMTRDQTDVADKFYKSHGFSDDKKGYQVRFGA